MKPIIFSIALFSSTFGAFSQIDESFKFRVTAPNGISDETILRIHDDATSGYDSFWDAWQLFPGYPQNPSVYSKSSEDYNLTVNAFDQMEKDTVINLYIRAQAVSGIYQLQSEKLGAWPDNIKVAIKDLETGIIFDLSNNISYNFDLTADPANDILRFEVFYSTKAVVAVDENDITITNAGNNNWNYNLYDSSSTFISNGQSSTEQYLLEDLNNGNYFLVVEDAYNLKDTLYFEIDTEDPTDPNFSEPDTEDETGSEGTAGLEKDTNSGHLIYQNAAGIYITLDEQTAVYTALEVYDLTGRMIYQVTAPSGGSQLQIPATGKQGQMIIVCIRSTSQMYQKKIILL